MDSIRRVLTSANEGRDFYILLGDFLDSFYRSDTAERLDMISERPLESDIEVQPIYAAFVASAAHKLANDYALAVPDWVYERKFYLARPFFGGNAKGNLRWWFMFNSPPEFKHRNLFVCESTLKRV